MAPELAEGPLGPPFAALTACRKRHHSAIPETGQSSFWLFPLCFLISAGLAVLLLPLFPVVFRGVLACKLLIGIAVEVLTWPK